MLGDDVNRPDLPDRVALPVLFHTEEKDGRFIRDIIVNAMSLRLSSSIHWNHRLLEVVTRPDRGLGCRIVNGHVVPTICLGPLTSEDSNDFHPGRGRTIVHW
jgi:hypothetical protein